MVRGKVRIFTLLILVCMLCTLFLHPLRAMAVSESNGYTLSEVSRGRRVNTYSLEGISNLSIYTHSARAIILNWKNTGITGRMINGEIYVPIRRFVEENVGGARVGYNASSRTITVTGGGHNISVSDGAYALYANGRVFFARTPSRIMSDGAMYVPASVLSKAFSLSYSVSAYGSLLLSGAPRVAKSGAEYYDSDILYWLSRIISAESKGESLVGQIAVGNVVLNRVRSPYFPNTVWGVIFDRKNGVQFSPVSNGTIYDSPAATSILAAKICLDGFTVSDRVLYFLRPSASTSSWIVNNRPFAFVIGNHYFFN